MSFTFADSRQLWLDISPTAKAEAWRLSQVIPENGARWQVYLNQLCISTCLDWFQTEILSSARAFPPPDANPVSWEMVSGSCIDLNGLKLVIIPTDAIDQDELLVPQEWVDIPNWTADYYLAVRVNPGENWVEIWGYTSYQGLKANGNYDAWERAYGVDADDLKDDISGLWAVIDHCPTADLKAATTGAVDVAELSTIQAENLVTRLAGETFPRLSVPFTQWGALLEDQGQRQMLYEQRLNGLEKRTSNASLTRYLQGMCSTIATGWQSIEAVFSVDAQQLAFRSNQRSNQLNEETAGQQAKVLQLGPELDNLTVRLAVIWEVLQDERIEVQAQVYPSEDHLYLPENLDFRLVSTTGEVIQALKTEATNNYIQIQRIRCPMRYQFSLELEFKGSRLVENITV